MWERSHEPLPRHLPGGWRGKVATKTLGATRLGAEILTLNLPNTEEDCLQLDLGLPSLLIWCRHLSCGPTKNLEKRCSFCVWLWSAEGLGINFLTAVCRLLGTGGVAPYHGQPISHPVPSVLGFSPLPLPTQDGRCLAGRLPFASVLASTSGYYCECPTRPIALMHAQRSEYYKCCH